jgi:indole-3-glycerol phosphate synthase
LEYLYESARRIGLDVLVEVHNEQELKTAVTIGAKIIGINNRNLKTFEIDLSTTERLRGLVPSNTVCVSESGVSSYEDIVRLMKINVDAALVGERIMTATSPEAAVRELTGEGYDES